MKLTENSIRRIIRQLILSEGVYDPGVLKAIFMAGGPGSGKSHTAKAILGGDTENALSTMTSVGLKLVNSDPAFEHFLKKAGIDPGSLGTLSQEEFEKATVGPDSPRGKAKSLRDKTQSTYMKGRLGLVIDGTGDDFGKIAAKKSTLEEAGYDTFMIFVNTSLDVAQERNANRERKLPADLVEEIWNDVQQNLGKFQGLFGAENLAIVDNTEYGPVTKEVNSAVSKFIGRDVRNPVGKKWLKSELEKKGPKARMPKKSGQYRGR
tara:strand:- start:234 stop:1025 length:792 start_codon:yes stop_codon:yes gene_type:complete